MTDLPRYLTEDIDSEEFKNYGSRVVVTVMGSILEQVDSDKVGRKNAKDVELRDSAMKEMEWTEKLEKSIINVEMWLSSHWLEIVDFPEEIEIDDDRIFLSDLSTAEVAIDLDLVEVIKASRQRAIEDQTHFLYVLGNWAYHAEKSDHVAKRTSHKLRRVFDRAKQNSPNPPGDATFDESGGGRYDK